jgi:membrane fusion protein (multidrug efflux system)
MRPTAIAGTSLIAVCALAACGKAAAPAAPPAPPLVETEAAASAPLDVVIATIGRVGAVDAVTLTPKASGIIGALKFEDGAEVGQGALLVELDTAEAAASLREAQATRESAKLELDRSAPLAPSGIVDANKLDQLRAALAISEARVAEAQARLDDRKVFAPFPGRLGLRQVSIGALVAPGTPIATLTRMTPVKLTFAIPERELARIKRGLIVRASAPAFGERRFEGAVTAVEPTVDPATHTVAVQALLPNPDEALRPGLSLDVELVAEHLDAAVLVPERAVVLQGAQAVVFTVDASGEKPVAKRLPVAVGVRREGRVQIATGLAAGAPVVVEGLQSVRDGAPVTLKPPPEKPAAAPAPTAAVDKKG